MAWPVVTGLPRLQWGPWQRAEIRQALRILPRPVRAAGFASTVRGVAGSPGGRNAPRMAAPVFLWLKMAVLTPEEVALVGGPWAACSLGDRSGSSWAISPGPAAPRTQ